MKYDVDPLFAEPLFRTDLSSAVNPEQIEFIKNLNMVQNRTNLISENLYIFELPELASVKSAVHDALQVYASEVMGIEQELYVTQSWSLINHPNVGMHGHSHSNSIVSGSFYYCDIPEPSSQMVFDRYREYRMLEINPLPGKRSVYNTNVNVIVPKTGELILFSSGLQHYVETNTTDQVRYSIAFNAFIKGKLGSYRDVSELTL